MHGKHNKHVDNLLISLLKFSGDQIFEWLIRLTKGKQTMRQKNMHESHLASKHMAFTSINEVTDGNFEVTSESSKLLEYNVNKLQDSCELTNCYIRCCECNVCVHTFTCTCPHFSITACSCKHIQFVKRYLFSKNPHSEENIQTMR